MTAYDELMEAGAKKFEQEIFPLLLNNKLVKRNTGLTPYSYPKVMDRLELQKMSIESKISLLHKHIDSGNKLGSFDKSILHDLTFVLTQAMFGYFQILQSYLRNFVDLPKIKICDDMPEFGQIIQKLAEFKNTDGGLVFHHDGLRKFFNVDLSRVLEHNSWWLNENSEFTFEESDGTLISFNVGELQGELAYINAIVLTFTESYVKNFDGTNYENMKRTYPQLFR